MHTATWMARGLACCLAWAVAAPLAAAAPAKPKAEAGKAETESEAKSPYSADTFAGLELRGIGPAVASGRIADFAVDPANRARYFVAVASGGVWKTENAGTTWTPVFDKEGSYSIGDVELDPKNPYVVWVGTGENNSQRSVGYGDGVYKSEDGGKSWKKMGLERSEHIGKIVIDPRDSKVVYVAAQGPLWGPGGDRGLYKTTDAGKSWKKILEISENTGVSDLVYDPRDPDVLIASAYQRRRHVWTLINGGRESTIYKSTDAGASWKKVDSGLPKVDKGRIGLAISPVDPDVVYAIVEAADGEGGFFRSTNRGETWEKRSKYMSSSPQYYNEIIADPVDVDRVYSMDTFLQVTDDGGKSFRRLGQRWKHVDEHALWIDPRQPSYYLSGCDGGVYESFDRGATWHFKANLPITQFYRVSVDNSWPVYYVYGGTQDNNTLGGPSRTLTLNGAMNSDWFVTQGGDGFWSAIDPIDPNIVYSEAQYGVLTRFDRKSGENVDIQPQPGAGEPALRWNWDAPLIISPHSPTRLYFAAEKLFRSDNRGDSWRAVSSDLSRQLDRNQLPVMGKIQRADAVAKSASTSLYGSIVALSESPKAEGLLYVGTDDGLVQVSEDGGGAWRKIESFPGVPERSYVSALLASPHEASTVYAAFNNHQMADFKPYLLRSSDRGKSWLSIAGDLPERGSVWAIAEDPGQANLLFAGTEFGLFFSQDGGKKWLRLSGNLPTIAVRQIAIQQRENDLVLGTFGRGFYILDDYRPLRTATPALLERPAALFAVKPALAYIPKSDLGGVGKASLGESLYTAPNPPFGAVFTYHLKEELQSAKKARQKMEEQSEKEGKTPPYPTLDQLRAEAAQPAPKVVLMVRDEDGHLVREIVGETRAGIRRVAWDLRFPASDPVSLRETERDPWDFGPLGPLVLPGRYSVEMVSRVDGAETRLAGPESFEVKALNLATLPAADGQAVVAFQRKTARLQRAVLGAARSVAETRTRLDHIDQALLAAPGADAELRREAKTLRDRLLALDTALSGDDEARRRNEADPPSIVERVQNVVFGHWLSTQAPTRTQEQGYAIAAEAFEKQLAELRRLIEVDLVAFEKRLDGAGAPWTPGRLVDWKRE